MQLTNKTHKFILPVLILSVLILGFAAAPAVSRQGHLHALAQDGANPPTDITLTSTAIAENNAVGDPVGTLGAVDPDLNDTFTFTFIDTTADSSDCSDNSAFTIEGSSLNAAVSFNFESKSSYLICLEVTDVEALTYDKALTISVTNVNEPPSAVVHGTPPFTIAENSGSSVHLKDSLGADVTIELSDVDAGDSISLVEAPSDPAFAVGSVSGNTKLKVITGAGSGANYEALPLDAKYKTYTLQPKDNHSLLGDTFNVTIDITDVNEAPVFTFGTHAINENSQSGDLVSNAFAATDPEGNNPVTISLLPDTPNDPYAAGDTFTLNSENFLVVNNNTLLNYESKTYLYVNLRATDSTDLYTDIRGKVTIKDINEPPVFTKQDLFIKENSTVFEVPNGNDIIATDPEKKSLSYTTPFDSANPCNTPYKLTNVTDTTTSPTTYKTTVSKNPACTAPFDYETKSKWDIPVTVTDYGSVNSVTEPFTIWILNVNEPITIDPDQVFITGDSDEPGTILGLIQYHDPDVSTEPTFSVIGGTGTSNFTVDQNTGEISVITSNGLNYYQTPTLTLQLLVTDNGSGTSDAPTSFKEWLTIQLTDDNDPPGFVPDNNLTIPEHSANNTAVGTIQATDPQDNNISFSIVGGTGAAAFAMDATSGAISVKDGSLVDYENASSHQMTLTVKALDDGTPSLYSTYTYIIHLADIEEPPTINPSTMTTYEKALGTTVVGAVDASDPDEGDILTYKITGGTGQTYFDIGVTGKVTVKPGALLTYPSPPLTLDIKVTDSYAQWAAATVTINITPKANLAIENVTVEPIIVVGSSMKYELTVTNIGQGTSSTYLLDITLPATVSFIPEGSTEGCVMKTASIIECSDPDLKLNQACTPGDSKTYTINAYLSKVTSDNAQVNTHFDVQTDTNETDGTNNAANIDFTAKKYVEVTNQNFENLTVQDFYLQGTDQNKTLTPITSTARTPNPDNVRNFLGTYSNDMLVFQKDNLLSHSKIKVSFDLYIGNYWFGINTSIDQPSYWKLCQGLGCEGSTNWLVDTTFSTWIDSNPDLFAQNYPYSCAPGELHPCVGAGKVHPPLYSAVEVGQLGYSPKTGWAKDAVYHIDLPAFAHTDSTLILKFLADNLTDRVVTPLGIWGIDNVKVTISGEEGYSLYIPFTRRK